MSRNSEPSNGAVPAEGARAESTPGGGASRATGRKLFVAFGIHIGLLILLGLTVLGFARAVWMNIHQQLDAARPRIAAAHDMEASVLSYSLGVQAALVSGATNLHAEAQAGTARVETAIAEYQRWCNTRRRVNMAADFGSRWRELRRLGGQLMAAGRPASPDELARFNSEAVALAAFTHQELQREAGGTLVALMEGSLGDVKRAAILIGLLLSVGLAFGVATSIAAGRTVLGSQAALSASARQWQATFDSVGDAVLLLDVGGRIVRCNGAARRQFGAGRPSLIGSASHELIAPGTQPADGDLVARVGRSRQRATCELELGGRWYHATADPVLEPGGKLTGVVLVLQDITGRAAAERQLRESEERLRLALDAGCMGTWEWDVRSGKAVWAPEAERLWGLRPGEFDGTYEHWRRLVHPADLPTAEARAQRALADPAAPYEFEHRIIRPDGAVRWMFAKAITLRDAGGQPLRMVGLNVDITGRKEAEERLRESEALLRAAFDNAPFEFWVRDANEVCIMENKAVVEHWGSILGQRPEDSNISKESLAIWKENNRRAFAGALVQGEIRLHESGRVRWMRNVISPFRVDGQIRGILGFNFDITALKEAEAAFKEKQVLLQAILDYSPTLISIKDLEGKVILANRNFAVLDLPPLHELVGRNVFELFPEEVARELWQNDLAAVKAGGPIESEEIVKHKDGQWHTYLTVKFPVYREEGRALGTCAISTDITERKEALQAMRDARNQLEQRVAERTAELAHANQRLTAEIAERALLQEELVAAGDRERHRVGQNLHDGLCQILTAARYKTDSLLTRLEAGSPIEEKARSIAGLVAQAVDEARCLARGLEPVEPLPEGLMAALQQLAAATSRLFNVSCECEYPEPVLVSDPQAAVELFRIAQEATHNGIKHGQASTICLRLVAEAEETVLTVTNNGRPISQTPATDGLGLKIMRYRSERIGAQLTIEPGATGGTVLCCRLPRIRTTPEKEGP